MAHNYLILMQQSIQQVKKVMSLLTILEYPDPKLRTIASPVKVFDARIRNIVKDMLETMYDAPGIGLAATQVDIHERIVVIDISEEKNQPLVLINPEVEVLEGEPETMEEGCLSVPSFYEEVSRVNHCKLNAFDETGKAYEKICTGLLAVCVQHELDHLNGKLFVDYLSPLKRNRIKSKLEKKHKLDAKKSN